MSIRALVVVLLVACSSRQPPGTGDGVQTAPDQDAGPVVNNGPSADAGPVAAPPADAGVPRDATAPMFPGLQTALVAPGVQTLFNPSQDDANVAVSYDSMTRWCTCNPKSSPACTEADNVEVSIVSKGAPAVSLGVTGRSAGFAGDGRIVVVSGGTCDKRWTWLVRPDGTGLRPATVVGSAGSWLYLHESDGIYRVRDLDTAPELFVADPLAILRFSPDGEALLVSSHDDTWLVAQDGSARVRLPIADPWSVSWTEDGQLLSRPCTVYDRQGQATAMCDPSAVAPNTAVQLTGGNFIFFAADAGGPALHVRDLVTGTETAFSPLPGAFSAEVTSDGRWVIATVPDRDVTAITRSVYTVPRSGGDWTPLGDHVISVAVSPDSRVFVFNTVGHDILSNGIVHDVVSLWMSLARGPAVSVNPPVAIEPGPPVFEPAGGFGKAIYFGSAFNTSAIANADGTGWKEIPAACMTMWIGHTALCRGDSTWHFAVGDQWGKIADGVRDWSLSHDQRRLYFTAAGGLYVTNIPAP